jgi:hypothetical protein
MTKVRGLEVQNRGEIERQKRIDMTDVRDTCRKNLAKF